MSCNSELVETFRSVWEKCFSVRFLGDGVLALFRGLTFFFGEGVDGTLVGTGRLVDCTDGSNAT